MATVRVTERGDEMPTIRSEPCRNCDVEIYLDMVGERANRDWRWLHVPVELRRTDAGEPCEEPEPRRRWRRGEVFQVER